MTNTNNIIDPTVSKYLWKRIVLCFVGTGMVWNRYGMEQVWYGTGMVWNRYGIISNQCDRVSQLDVLFCSTHIVEYLLRPLSFFFFNGAEFCSVSLSDALIT
jgi:hypothetical protein